MTDWLREPDDLTRGLLFDAPLLDSLTAERGGPSVAPTFLRDAAETYTDALGDTQSAGVNVPAFGYASGVQGVQAFLNGGHPDKLSYPQSGNLDWRGGVISFRTLPNWAWTALGVGSAYVFLDSGGTAANQNRLTFTGIATNVMRFTVWSATAGVYRLIDIPVGALSAGWHVFTLAYTSAGPTAAYVDGVRSGTAGSSGVWANITTLGSTFYVGQQYTAGNQADATLSHLRIYGPSRVKDADRLAEELAERFVWYPPPPDFTYWVTEAGAYVTDDSGNHVKTK